MVETTNKTSESRACLFATTIWENIILGRPDANQVVIEEATRVANAHSFIIKLPEGYETQVSQLKLMLLGEIGPVKNAYFVMVVDDQPP